MSALGTRLLNGGVVETRRRAAAAKAAAASQQQGGAAGGGATVPVYRHASSGGESSPDEDPSSHQLGLAVLGKVNEEEISRGGVVTYNMVAAMNEHLSSSPLTSSIRSPSASKDKLKDQIKAKDKSGGTAVAAEDSKVVNLLGFPCDFDHMYASMTDDGAPATATSVLGVSPLRGSEARQNDLSEVKHLKELLLLHLDLIQQQSEQIVTKDKLLAGLRQENETLKLRIERIERRRYRSDDSTENAIDHLGSCSPPNLSSNVNSLPSTSDHNTIVQSNAQSPQYPESLKIRLNTSGGITTVKQEISDNFDCKQETMDNSWGSRKKRKSSGNERSSKRKRGVSSSSTVSNDTSSTIPESLGGKGHSHHETAKKLKEKGKSLIKKESFLTTEEHYYTAVGEPKFILALNNPSSPENTPTNLEVPSWRTRVYSSCYTMEGTENLEDEIYNKRHGKLEVDEKRRKRWDVQRIREQRLVEKLKQRQEKQNHNSACYTNHSGPCPASPEEEKITTLWPEPEQVQSIQVDSQLPISAFGASVASFQQCQFLLPWSIGEKSKARRLKRLNNKKKKSKR